VPFDGTGLSLHTLVKSNCRNIVFSLKVTRLPRFVQGRKWLNGAKSKSYLVNRLPFSEPSLLGTIGKMRLVFILYLQLYSLRHLGDAVRSPSLRHESSSARQEFYHSTTPLGPYISRDMDQFLALYMISGHPASLGLMQVRHRPINRSQPDLNLRLLVEAC
jgi:hypothetical protein